VTTAHTITDEGFRSSTTERGETGGEPFPVLRWHGK
jgi:hypothetical protein